MKNKKLYVFDTNVFIADPKVLENEKFGNADIWLPVVVLDEVDKLKKQPGNVGRNCRLFIRWLDELKGNIVSGITLKNGSLFKVDAQPHENKAGDKLYGDNRLIDAAIDYKKSGNKPIVISNDISLRCRAKAFGLSAQKYEKTNSSYSEIYSGIKEIVDEQFGADLLSKDFIEEKYCPIKLHPNEFIVIKDNSSKHIVSGRKHMDGKIRSVQEFRPWDLKAKNIEQSLAIDVLLDPRIPLVSLSGLSGSGKTILMLAAALEMTLEKRMYDKILLYKSIESVGKEIGFLPGDQNEKLICHYQSIMDNFEVLFKSSNNDKWRQTLDMLFKRGKINMEAISFIRGRSLPRSFVVLDEAQNLGKDEIKTILTRIGKGTKLIINGDIQQIDNNSLDMMNNGLTYVIDKFKESNLSAHITFTIGERSDLANEAVKLL